MEEGNEHRTLPPSTGRPGAGRRCPPQAYLKPGARSSHVRAAASPQLSIGTAGLPGWRNIRLGMNLHEKAGVRCSARWPALGTRVPVAASPPVPLCDESVPFAPSFRSPFPARPGITWPRFRENVHNGRPQLSPIYPAPSSFPSGLRRASASLPGRGARRSARPPFRPADRRLLCRARASFLRA